MKTVGVKRLGARPIAREIDKLAAAGRLTRASQPKHRWTWRADGIGLPAGTAAALLGELRRDR